MADNKLAFNYHRSHYTEPYPVTMRSRGPVESRLSRDRPKSYHHLSETETNKTYNRRINNPTKLNSESKNRELRRQYRSELYLNNDDDSRERRRVNPAARQRRRRSRTDSSSRYSDDAKFYIDKNKLENYLNDSEEDY